ncbi:chaperone NapD [Thermopetrobacter sp. TC1]|uniref:chaperone NapD n=1 Tax=Thermopetrobacter sp. TC1 TaxID=1495045 RepID=UPI00068B351F|nr:chaperone NapD [Thermopetrobacter sp. TC1]
MSICSLVVFTKPEATETVKAEIEKREGCEVPGHEAGKLVVLMDHPSREVMSQTIMDIHNITGVISVSLVYEYFEDNGQADRDTGKKDAAKASSAAAEQAAGTA